MTLSQISQIYTSAYFTCESLSIWTVLRLDILSHVNFPFSCVFWHVKRGGKLAFRCGNPKLCLPSFLIKDASFSRPQNLHKCISLVEVYRFGQCLGERFSPISTFFSLESSRAFIGCAPMAVLVSGSQTMFTGLFKDARFGLFQI